MDNEKSGKLREWVNRIFKRPTSEGSTYDVIMEGLRKAQRTSGHQKRQLQSSSCLFAFIGALRRSISYKSSMGFRPRVPVVAVETAFLYFKIT